VVENHSSPLALCIALTTFYTLMCYTVIFMQLDHDRSSFHTAIVQTTVSDLSITGIVHCYREQS